MVRMPWRRRPATLDECAARLAEAIAMSRGGARPAESEALLDRLVADATVAETAARGTAGHAGLQRVLGRALWRLAQVRHAAGRPAAALQPARLSVAFAVAYLDRLTAGTPPTGDGTDGARPAHGSATRHPGADRPARPPAGATDRTGDDAPARPPAGAPGRLDDDSLPWWPAGAPGRTGDDAPVWWPAAAGDRPGGVTGRWPDARVEALEHVVVHLCDAGEIAAAAGQPDERVTLLGEAIRRGEHATEDPVRRAVGTALHNLANAHAATLSRGARPPRLLAEAATLADRARTLRAAFVTEADPMTVWEYANTLVMCAGVAALGRRWADGVAHLSEAAPLLSRLGPPASEIASRAGRHAQLMRMAAPRTVARARAAGRWPY
ncbi:MULTISPECIES: serine/threonine-protein kinase [Catenuloplanes]|uniref:Uncharacterized protein n=1 Tax=Catenuloplanes niger TaxID=587534 RepID=A0AAE4A041_9ACTN|nr:hypothetical protein [Catenuloplanes niger]MDR7327996.1 hypothetical protein [Catenuloplanes niger]